MQSARFNMQCPICENEAGFWQYFKTVPILQCTAGDCGFCFFYLPDWKSPYSKVDYYESWRPGPLAYATPWNRARVDIVKKFKQTGAVAELGCGIGETALALSKAGYQVVGVEESPKAIDFLKKEYPGTEWVNENILQYLNNNPRRFDVITMFHVLEHIPEPKNVIRLVDAALRPGGVIVIEVPDVGGGFARLKGLNWDYFIDHHVNYFDAKSLTKLLGLVGYRLKLLERTYHFSFPQGNMIKDFIKGSLARLGMNSIIRTVWAK